MVLESEPGKGTKITVTFFEKGCMREALLNLTAKGCFAKVKKYEAPHRGLPEVGCSSYCRLVPLGAAWGLKLKS